MGDALEGQPEEVVEQAYQDSVELLSGYVVDGSVEMQGCAWLVRASC
jgi:hypothetical protein